MIKYLTLTWECCNCKKLAEERPALEREVYKDHALQYLELIPISTELYWQVPENWVRSRGGKMYCEDCHMKKEPK